MTLGVPMSLYIYVYIHIYIYPCVIVICMSSQKASGLGLIVGKVVFLECAGNGSCWGR